MKEYVLLGIALLCCQIIFAQKSDTIYVESMTLYGLANDNYFYGNERFSGRSVHFSVRTSGATPQIMGRRRAFPRWIMKGANFYMGAIKTPGAEPEEGRGWVYQAETMLGLRIAPFFDHIGKSMAASRWLDPYVNLVAGYKISTLPFTTKGNLLSLSMIGGSLYIKPLVGIQTFPFDKLGFFAEVNPLNPVQLSFGLNIRGAKWIKRSKK